MLTPSRPKNDLLAAAVARSGHTYKDVALAAGIHPVTLSNLLNRQFTAKPETARKLAAVLGVEPDTLGLTGRVNG